MVLVQLLFERVSVVITNEIKLLQRIFTLVLAIIFVYLFIKLADVQLGRFDVVWLPKLLE